MALTSTAPLIKSRHRVRTYGEVFTLPSMVNQMLDLVKDDSQNVDATFLEPAAGNGNFLTAILRRKLATVKRQYPKQLWRQESLFALASIYGIELLEDNFIDARYNMAVTFMRFHERNNIPCGFNTYLFKSARHILDANLVLGNTLVGLDASGKPIEFSWWHREAQQSGMVQREPFTLESLKSKASFDFYQYASYEPCHILQVHKERPRV